MYSSAYVWAKILSHMEESLGAITISASFDDAEVVELTEDQLILYSPSDFRREVILRRYAGYIQDALKDNPCGQGDEMTPLILIRPL